MPTLRRDAARNRDLILTAARELSAEGESLQLNSVAHRAEVGVGTVYRHFATPEALGETLVEHRFAELIEAATQAADTLEPVEALRAFMTEALQVNADDPAFAAASVNPAPARPETAALRGELIAAFTPLVRAAAPSLRAELDGNDLLVLLCGIGYSARLRPEKSLQYLDSLLTGVLREQ